MRGFLERHFHRQHTRDVIPKKRFLLNLFVRYFLRLFHVIFVRNEPPCTVGISYYSLYLKNPMKGARWFFQTIILGYIPSELLLREFTKYEGLQCQKISVFIQHGIFLACTVSIIFLSS
ncbi:hypothetical protein AO730_04790 [Aeromonas veronii]|nr:hypothetical protein AO722_10390 [Aeromonas veronii]KRW15803.1 hypothetical protein AO732_00925 [Aeromonas veronii]KRW16915.1 hypothetical protein AO734_09040 [Aeromonas veronii]KRW38853.1 hypothetical protein AO744_14140 [Aeromonas veronii]KRW41534.1 hypothetical protein AO730_04790 [Aeromonas veronii]